MMRTLLRSHRIAIVVAAMLWILFVVLLFPHLYLEAFYIGIGLDNFQELSDRFTALAKNKGADYAFEVLRRADLPPGTDFHLLGHIIGDVLYQQRGIQGMAECTEDFRNACSHSIVINVLVELGPAAALIAMRDACHQAPGGSGAYTMCTHGIGHGIFAYYDYDLKPTIAWCSKLGTSEYGDREYIECVGGAIMELMGGGGHDHGAWEKSREKYLDPKDPLAPCSTAIIPKAMKGICYTYLAPQLFEAAGGDLSHPSLSSFIGAFRLCDRIPKAKKELREACFGGIGKEFPGLALERDIRKIESASDADLARMYSWCDLAPHEEAHNACIRSIVQSLFWGGENNPDVSVRFCAVADDETGKKTCLEQLYMEANRYFAGDDTARANICATLPQSSAPECRKQLDL